MKEGDKKMITRRNFGLLAAAMSLGFGAQAQTYPDKPIKLVVPFAAGGYVDTVGRLVGKHLQGKLGASVVVENRAGAGGNLGTAHAARQPADGYTILLSPLSFVIGPEADKILNRQPQYQINQFTPVAMVTAETLLVVVPANSPWKTLDDLIRDARQRPDKISYSSSGVYGNIHLPTEMLFRKASAQVVHVPYQGGAPAMVAVLSGEVNFTLQSPAVAVPHLKSGKVRILATLGAQRQSDLPDVPTVRELGHDMELASWSTLFVPVGTPETVVSVLRSAVRDITSDAEFRSAIAAMNSTIRFLEGDALQKAIARDASAMADVVRSVGRIE
jgi:tripartite-type tricarboxylate transporter receptor subunit TctC